VRSHCSDPRSRVWVTARSAGFTLVEVLIATMLFTAALSAVVQLLLLVSRAAISARDASYAGLLASQKLSELTTDDRGSLVASPPDAWMRSTTGHIEYLDSTGVVVGTGAVPPGNSLYVRRWSVTPLASDVTGGILLQVAVGRLHRDWLSGAPADAHPFDVARVVGVRTGTVP
jgi:type II secretory pathway pseudopilin PulG